MEPVKKPTFAHNFTRRDFVKNTAVAAGAGILLTSPLLGKAANLIAGEDTYTVKQIMDTFIKDVPGGVLVETVDTLKAGSPDTVVTGIVTTMFPTIAVIRETIDRKANFIIGHEPTFYNHTDETDWLKEDDVYKYKAELLKQHNIVIWRNHDYIHRLVPDGVTTGVLNRLDWAQYSDHDT